MTAYLPGTEVDMAEAGHVTTCPHIHSLMLSTLPGSLGLSFPSACVTLLAVGLSYWIPVTNHSHAMI